MLKETFFALSMACAPNVDVNLLYKIAVVESSLNEFAVNINNSHLSGMPSDLDGSLELVAKAGSNSFDVGLMGINSGNFNHFGVSLIQIFDPCTNISVGAQILTDNYRRAKSFYSDDQTALIAALSAYNTGNFIDGLSNGYVDKYLPSQPVYEPEYINQSQSAPETAHFATTTINLPMEVNTMSNETSVNELVGDTNPAKDVNYGRALSDSEITAIELDPETADKIFFDQPSIEDGDDILEEQNYE